MNTTQIWVFGILGFVVLWTFAKGMTRRRSLGPEIAGQHEMLRELAEKTQTELALTREQVSGIAEDASDIKRRLDAIETTLREVE